MSISAASTPVAGTRSPEQRPAPAPATGPTLLAIVVTIIAWASAFIVIREVRTSFAPGALALGRLLVGTVALGAVLVSRRAWVAPTRREWLLLVACGVSWFAIYNVALNAGERRIDAGTAAMVVNVGPILIALLAGLLLKEGFPRWLLIGAGVAFGGAVLIGIATATSAHTDVAGVGLCLLAAVCWALGVMAQKPVLRRLPAIQVTALACAVGAVALLPFSGQLLTGLRHASASGVAGLVYLGAVPTAVAFVTWAYALSRMGAGRLGVSTYLVPPLTVLGAWPVLGETPPVLALAGGALALVGVSLTRRGR